MRINRLLIFVILFVFLFSNIFSMNSKVSNDVFEIEFVNVHIDSNEKYVANFKFVSKEELLYVDTELLLRRNNVFFGENDFYCNSICEFSVELKENVNDRFKLLIEVEDSRGYEIEEELFFNINVNQIFQKVKYETTIKDSYYLDNLTDFHLDFSIDFESSRRERFFIEIYSKDNFQNINSKHFRCRNSCDISLPLPSPLLAGDYIINIYSRLGEIQKEVSFLDKELEVNVFNSNSEKIDLNISEKMIDGSLGIELNFENLSVEKVYLPNISFDEIDLGIEEVPISKVPIEDSVNAFAIDPEGMDGVIEDFYVTFTAKANVLYKCEEYDFENQNCFGSFVKVMDTIPGVTYNITLNPKDPLFVEVNEPYFNVQRGSITQIGSTITQSISSIIENETLLLFSSRTNDPNPQDWQFTSNLNNPTQIQFDRYLGTSVSSTIEYEIISSDLFNVQRGNNVLGIGTNFVDVSLSNSVNLSQSFIVVNGRCNSASNNNNHAGFFRAFFVDSSTIRLERGQENLCEAIATWQVVDFEGSNVQSNSISFSSTETSLDSSISTVNLSQSFLLFGFSASIGTDRGMDTNFIYGQLNSPTNVNFVRTGDAGVSDRDISYFVISHPQLSVQRNIFSSAVDITQTFSPLTNISKSFHKVTTTNSGGGQTYSNNAYSSALNSLTSLFFDKETGSQTVFASYEVIEFISEESTIDLENDINISSSSPNNLAGENLMCSYNLGNDAIDGIVSWEKNSNSFETLILSFEGGSVSAFNDFSSNNVLVTNNLATYLENVSNASSYGVYQFDGTNSYLDLGEPTELDFNGIVDFTISTLVNIDSSSGNRPVVCKGDTQYCLKLVPSGQMEFCAYDTGWKCAYSNSPLPTNIWTHIGAKVEGTEVSLFIDGVKQTTTGTLTSGIQNTTATVNVGRDSSIPSRLFTGLMDEIRIYSQALSDSQIEQLSNLNYDILRGDETLFNENWRCSVTPVSASNRGTTYFSESLSLIGISSVQLLSESNQFLTSDELTCSYERAPTNLGEIITFLENSTTLDTFYLPIEGGISNSLKEYSSNNLTVTNNGATLILDGGNNSNNVLFFDGTSSYLDLGEPSELDFNGVVDFSISAFVTVDPSSSGNRPIVCKGDTQYCLKLVPSGQMEFCVYDTGWKCGYSNNPLPTNSWTHIVGRVEGTEVSVYINGVKQTTIGTLTSGIQNTADTVNIGRDSSIPSRVFQGNIDEVRIFSSALSESQINHLFLRENSRLSSLETSTNDLISCNIIPFIENSLGNELQSSEELILTDELTISLLSPQDEINVTLGDSFSVDYNVSCKKLGGCSNLNLTLFYGGVGSWEDSTFDRRKSITISNFQSTDLINQTVFINLEKESSMNILGNDLRFYNGECGLETGLLDYEISFSNSSHFGIWLRDDVYESNSNSYCVYYSNTSSVASYQNRSAVWDGFTAVWHFEEIGTNSRIDSTNNLYNAIPRNFDLDEKVSSVVGQGDTLDGVNDYLAIENLFYNTQSLSEITVCNWFSTTFVGTGYNNNWAFLDFDRSDFFDFYLRSDNNALGFSTDAGGIQDQSGTVTGLNNGNWHFGCAIYDGTDKILYTNGVESGRITNAHAGQNLGGTTARYGFIGEGSEASTFDGPRNNIYYEGAIDELFYLESAKSPQEILEWYNIMNGVNTVIFGSEEIDNTIQVSNIASTLPFWTTQSNPNIISLLENESTIVSFPIDITTLSKASYNVFLDVEGYTFTNLNFTLNIFEFPSLTFSLNQSLVDYQFNANRNDLISVDYTVNCIGEIDCSGFDVYLGYGELDELGEVGKISLENNEIKNISFLNNYSSTPIMILTPATDNLNDNNHIIPIIHSINTTHVFVSLCEDAGLTTCSTVVESEELHYMVFDVDKLDNYSWIQYGRVNANSNGVGVPVTYSSSFTNTPYIYTTPQSKNLGGNAIFPTSWTSSVSTTGFSLFACDHPGTGDICAGTTTEEFGYVAIDPILQNLINSQLGTVSVPNSDWTPVSFARSYQNPIIAVSQDSENGGQDPQYPWARNVNSNGADVRYCEADGAGVCDTHNAEDVMWMVFEEGILTVPKGNIERISSNIGTEPIYTTNQYLNQTLAHGTNVTYSFDIVPFVNPVESFQIFGFINYTPSLTSESFSIIIENTFQIDLGIFKTVLPSGNVLFNFSNLAPISTPKGKELVVYLYGNNNSHLNYSLSTLSNVTFMEKSEQIGNYSIYEFVLTPNLDQSVFGPYGGIFNSSNSITFELDKSTFEGEYYLGMDPR